MYAHWQNFNVCADDALMQNGEQIAFCDHETGSESYLHWKAMTGLLELVSKKLASVDEIIEEALTIPANYERTSSMYLGGEDFREYSYMDTPDLGRDHQHVPYELVEQEDYIFLSRAGIDCVSINTGDEDYYPNSLFIKEHWQDMLRILNAIIKRNDTAEYVVEALLEKYGVELEMWDEDKAQAYYAKNKTSETQE